MTKTTQAHSIKPIFATTVLTIVLVLFFLECYSLWFRHSFSRRFPERWLDRDTKVEVVPGVFVWQTSGRDASLADEEGVALVDANVDSFWKENTNSWWFTLVRKDKETVYAHAVRDSVTGKGLLTIEKDCHSGRFRPVGSL